MIHFIIHVSTDQEIEKLVYIREQLAKFFPAALLHVFNQTLQPVEGSIVCENIKECGFGWTLRYLRYAFGIMQPEDVVIRIDPDTEILGNPLAGLYIPQGSVFGQFYMESDCCASIFYGAFQGYTYDAVKSFLLNGPAFENELGAQDLIVQQIVNIFEIPRIDIPNIELWDTAKEPKPHYLVWHRSWRSKRG